MTEANKGKADKKANAKSNNTTAKSNRDVDMIDFLKEVHFKLFRSLLQMIQGNKILILDNTLISSLDYIGSMNQLKECGVEKIFKLETGLIVDNTAKHVYVVRPLVDTMKIIASNIKAKECSEAGSNYWIIFIPRKLYICDAILEQEGVYGCVKQLEFPLGFIPVDSDLISLELMDFFPSVFMMNDQTHLYTVAMALLQLQKLYGSVPKLYAQGHYAEAVLSMMKNLQTETKGHMSGYGSISHLIVIDRDADFISVLLTQLAFEGLLDETFDIKSGRVSFGKDVTGQDQTVKVILNNSDPIYQEIRNCHFILALAKLQDKAKQLKAKCEVEFQEQSELTLQEMKRIVTDIKQNAPQQRRLSYYIGACEVIMKKTEESNFQEQLMTEQNLVRGINLKDCQIFIEDAINKQVSIFCVLRLLCLFSITQDGLPSKDYKSLITQFLQSYGHKHMLAFHRLKKIGIFDEQLSSNLSIHPSSSPTSTTASKIAERVVAAVVSFPKQNSFKMVTKKMSLVPPAESVQNLKNPKDMSYIFAGTFIPLAGKLVDEIIHNDGSQKSHDILKMLPGTKIIEDKQIVTHGIVNNLSEKTGCPEVKIVIVCFLGGVTYAEVAALRFLSKIKGYTILIATTGIINGNSLMKMIIADDLHNIELS